MDLMKLNVTEDAGEEELKQVEHNVTHVCIDDDGDLVATTASGGSVLWQADEWVAFAVQKEQ